MVDWSYYDKFEAIEDKYLPAYGEGETMATQIVTAVVKLVYKWYNDGDVYDNTYHLGGWCNDLSTYANWLESYADVGYILYGIAGAKNESDYENILKALADATLQEDYLDIMDKKPKVGSIYSQEGPFKYEEPEEEDDWYEDEYYGEDEEEYL